MSPTIKIEREGCVNGKWSITDSEGTIIKVDSFTMAEHYISEHEKRPVTVKEFKRFEFTFQPIDPKDEGRQGVNGNLTINYELGKQ